MKKILFLGMIIMLIILNCGKQESKFPQGAWKGVSIKQYSDSKLEKDIFPGIYQGSDVKIWSKNHVNDIGKFQNDTSVVNLYFGGTYRLDGKRYYETVTYHFMMDRVPKEMKGFLELRNDTLIQTNGVDDNGKLNKTYEVYKFVRAE
jgi:hypothetical protein